MRVVYFLVLTFAFVKFVDGYEEGRELTPEQMTPSQSTTQQGFTGTIGHLKTEDQANWRSTGRRRLLHILSIIKQRIDENRLKRHVIPSLVKQHVELGKNWYQMKISKVEAAPSVSSSESLTDNGGFIDKRGRKRSNNKWPIVYSEEYNVDLWGLEKTHPFDSKKWRHIFNYLKQKNMLSETSIFTPEEATHDILFMVHTQEYLDTLKSYRTIMDLLLQAPLYLPGWILDWRYLKPMRFQVGGSILAGELAIHRGWAINIGGGFHHASKNFGEGSCPYADITLLIRWLFLYYPDQVEYAMIVDLDAHQGNGHERDFHADNRVYTMDVYNYESSPEDKFAKRKINTKVELEPFTSDGIYLDLVERSLDGSLSKFHPDILVYNAGTDILVGDKLGNLGVSPKGIIKRDEIVFRKAKENGVPIVMLTSGGYQKKTAQIIARSILNLKKKGLISK